MCSERFEKQSMKGYYLYRVVYDIYYNKLRLYLQLKWNVCGAFINIALKIKLIASVFCLRKPLMSIEHDLGQVLHSCVISFKNNQQISFGLHDRIKITGTQVCLMAWKSAPLQQSQFQWSPIAIYCDQFNT